MSIGGKRWYRSRRNQVLISLLILTGLAYYFALYEGVERENHDLTRREDVNKFIENTLEEALKYDKGSGCDIPRLDPFAKEVTQFDKVLPKLVCEGKDWVKCYLSECKVQPEILRNYQDVVCFYTDILYISDNVQKMGRETEVMGEDVYPLMESDHVVIKCTGKQPDSFISSSWSGLGTGFRPVTPKPSPAGRENSYNILIFGFDTTAKNGFIRKMPQSYKVLNDEVKATILNGYNIVGDGTPAALFPILTGKTELELPDVRKVMNKNTLDTFPFIFYKARDDGYRTAYFEDMPQVGTFQYRFNGWKKQPTDHYLRALLLQRNKAESKLFSSGNRRFCVGDTPSYKVMTNITEQFMSLSGKKFIFNFIADITHDDFNKIQTADEDTAQFLRRFMESDLKENTLLIVMGDHGPRFADIRATLQGKLEERLPLMAIRLPNKLVQARPEALVSLRHNVEVLTTPHDIYATILDVMDLRQHWNPYKIAGADLPRSLTLLQPISPSRSCSEAGVEPHWCACLSWSNVTINQPLYRNAATALLDYINHITKTVRSKCALRTLTSIDWVIVHKVKDKVAKFIGNKDTDGYMGRFHKNADKVKDTVQVKITVGPGNGVYEASLTHDKSTDQLTVNPREISRINAYGHEPDCISSTHPHLNPFCYCND